MKRKFRKQTGMTGRKGAGARKESEFKGDALVKMRTMSGTHAETMLGGRGGAAGMMTKGASIFAG